MLCVFIQMVFVYVRRIICKIENFSVVSELAFCIYSSASSC